MPANEKIDGEPLSSKLQGPENLAEAFNNFRHQIYQTGLYGSDKFTHLTDNDIEHLIKLCFHASIKPEESRFPRFRLFLPIYNQKEIESIPDIIQLNPPVALNKLNELHRLVPAVSSLEYALKVIKVENQLMCTAIILADDYKVLAQIGVDYKPSVLFGIMIRVDGPGNILISEIGFANYKFRLRNGDIKHEQSFNQIGIIDEWLKSLSFDLAKHYIVGESVNVPNPAFPNWAHMRIKDVCFYAIGQILQKTIDARHGGGFVIVPCTNKKLTKEALKEEFQINLKYITDKFDLGMQALNYWKSCNHDFIKESVEPEFEKDVWYQQKNYLETRISVLANLANVDGCVVLDKTLKVIGFGGEILIGDAASGNSGRTYQKHIWSDNSSVAMSEDEIKQFGTRNRSAFRFCNAHPGAIAFVISQDGDLRVYAGMQREAIMFDDVLSWTDLVEAR
jgi:hypothetical protein